jgi:hypothetical protein
MRETLRTRKVALLSAAVACAVVAGGCGGDDDFENDPRPAVPLQLTGVITEERLTVSPRTLAEGPVVLIVSNQTQQSHTITLEGEDIRETVGPVNPLDTAQIQRTLKPGSYEVKAGSEQATPKEITAGRIDVGPPRPSSSNDVLLP